MILLQDGRNRHALLVVLFCTYLLCYMDRMAIATAIPFIAAEFHLSPLSMGGVLSAFFLGYAGMQIPGGLLADKFGPKRTMAASIAGWSAFTALTGAANSLATLLGVRVLFGMAEGPYPPAASKTVALWFPKGELGRANGIQLASVNIGAAIAPMVVAPLIIAWGWRSVFYTLPVPGLLLACVVWKLVQDPATHAEDGSVGVKSPPPKIHFRDALQMPAVFWCCTTLFFTNVASWGLMNWLPTYLLQARGFDISKTGMFASLPYLSGALGYFLGGLVSDEYFSHRRHTPIAFGLLLGAIFTYLAAIATNGEWAVAALVMAFLLFFTSLGGIFTLPLVIVPAEAVGCVFGIVNTVGQVAAFLSPLLIGYLLNITDKNFVLVFYFFVGLFLTAACAAARMRKPLMVLQGTRLTGRDASHVVH